MANVAIFRINYKSDFILTLSCDAGWMTPFCIKFWTAVPSIAYFVGYDGTTYTNCAPVDGDLTKLRVQFDNHGLPIGELQFQIGYHFTVADFPTTIEDEVINQAAVIIDQDGTPMQVMLDFTGETAPEIQFSLPAYANEAQRIANEEVRIANEQQRIEHEEQRIHDEEVRQQNEAQRIQNENARVSEFARLKRESESATGDANDAAALAEAAARLAADKAELADDAARLANQKAELAAAKAQLAADAAALAHAKAQLAAGQAAYAKQQGDYAKQQGDISADDHTQAVQDHQIAVDDHTQAGNDHTRAESDHTQASDDHTQAGNDHTRAEQDHTRAGEDHTRAESDHTTAGNDHTTAAADHETAVSDHSTAGNDHTRAGEDHTRAGEDHTRAETDHAAVEVFVDSLGTFDLSKYNAVEGQLATYADLDAALTALNALDAQYKYGGMSFKFIMSYDNNSSRYVRYNLTTDDFSTDPADWEQDASIEKLESGDIIPKLAQNLESWEEDGGQDVSNTWDETIRTTAGDDPVDTTQGGLLEKIVAKTDFMCSSLLTTAYNQLRLKSNGGGAVAVGTGWYFPVPKLTLGSFGSAQENNGLLLTDNNGNNIQNATVYFKALADGVPTSITDGTQLTPTSVTYNNKTYKVYTTSGAGYLIVSGITYDNTCAHIAWEDWYDKFVSPTNPSDVGDNISLSALFTAAPNGSGKFLVCGGVATYAELINSTQMKITDPIGRVTSPSWTNTLQEDGETYLHSLSVSGMKSGGYALIEGSDQILIVEGTTVMYSDTNATAISGVVRYEKSTAATATVTLTKTTYGLNDCGIEMKEGAEGSAFFTNTYTQNIPDALSQIAKVKLDTSLGVIAEALLYLYNENKALREILTGRDNAILAYIRAINIECDQITMFGAPLVLRCSTAGAPSAANIPVNWDEETMDVWNGTPRFRGQQYIDTTNSKVYYAVKLTGSTSDWVALN